MTVDDSVRAQERRRLARELHDVVAHHLANVSLRTMGRLELADLGQLRAVLADINRATDSALAELRLLTHVLEDDPELLAGTDAVGELRRHLAPTAAAEQWRRGLARTGRPARVAVPAAADGLALSVQSTLARALDTIGLVALTQTGEGAPCSAAVQVDADEVTLRTALTLPDASPERGRDLARELRGLRERVDLSHGRLVASVSASDADAPAWVVVVTLPLD